MWVRLGWRAVLAGLEVPMAGESSSEITEQYGDRGAVLARLSWEWTVLHAVAWPGRPTATIDHVAIGPTGVYVIVVGIDPEEARVGACAVAGYLPGLPRQSIHGVLVGAEHPAPWIEDDGVFLCETVDLVRLLRSNPTVLTNEEVAGIVSVVYVGIERTERARPAADDLSTPHVLARTSAGDVGRHKRRLRRGLVGRRRGRRPE